MINVRFVQSTFTPHQWQPEQDLVVIEATAQRKSLPEIAKALGLDRQQVKRRVQALGVGVGKDLRPGILDTLATLIHPCRPVTRAMLSKSAPGNRTALLRVINQMLADGELLGSPKDIRHPTVQVESKLFKQG